MNYERLYNKYATMFKESNPRASGDLINEAMLMEVAKIMTVVIYRNSVIEDVHAGEGFGAKNFKGIPDCCMKEINKSVCNRMYTMLKMLCSSDDIDLQRLEVLLSMGVCMSSNWDMPEIDDDIYINKNPTLEGNPLFFINFYFLRFPLCRFYLIKQKKARVATLFAFARSEEVKSRQNQT